LASAKKNLASAIRQLDHGIGVGEDSRWAAAAESGLVDPAKVKVPAHSDGVAAASIVGADDARGRAVRAIGANDLDGRTSTDQLGVHIAQLQHSRVRVDDLPSLGVDVERAPAAVRLLVGGLLSKRLEKASAPGTSWLTAGSWSSSGASM
jgi:hypothetical protein